ncbi:MAG: hypothetical protein QY316_03775 [Thermodesulfobacteriota bacterium]|nr:MAG: hypothetical protein QY316_03775 [Thermodesulfobacteriota bacterium]
MTKDLNLYYIEEPRLEFGHGQAMEDPKDGLMFFGPLKDARSPVEIRVGVIGSKEGINRYRKWVAKINSYIPALKTESAHHTAYPGFKTIFGCKWSDSPICELTITEEEMLGHLYLSDRHEAIFKTVGLFENRIRRYIREEDAHIDLWFIIIPEEIYKLGRPKSVVSKDLRVLSAINMTAKKARQIQKQPSLLFAEENEAAEYYKYELNFHNQLKARLLDTKAVLQIVRETSLSPEEFVVDERPLRRVQDPATLAWNLTTTTFFKASGRPWKLANVREGVCYVGIVFKRDMKSRDANNACCGAQMFLDSGDGLVFKGAVGPWYSDSTKEFHLPKQKAYELMSMVVDAYTREHGFEPKELFIHGRTRFSEGEWRGFQEAVPKVTNLVGVRIRDDKNLKMYGPGQEAVLRGTAFLKTNRMGFLWTRGYIPRLQTYPGREVPNPLSIEICRGNAELKQVMRDIIGLTKVNFNACIYADGYPVTLRFADHVGEILTSTPIAHELPPLPFKHYI